MLIMTVYLKHLVPNWKLFCPLTLNVQLSPCCFSIFV